MLPEGHIGLDSPEQVDGGFVESDERAVVELPETEESEDSDDTGVEFVDTSDPDDEGDFGFGGDVDLAGEFGVSSGLEFGVGGVFIIGFELLDSGEEFIPFGFVGGPALLA